MITFTITGDTFPVSDKLRAYIEKRFGSFERFMDENMQHDMIVRLSKVTAHTREDSFRAEAGFKLHTRDFFATGSGVDAMAAVDEAKTELMRELTQSNAKRRTLFHRGARKIKSLLRRSI